MSSEWRIGGVKSTWRRLTLKLPTDDEPFLKAMWTAFLRMNNFRVRVMEKGQMTNVFQTDCDILGSEHGGLWDEDSFGLLEEILGEQEEEEGC